MLSGHGEGKAEKQTRDGESGGTTRSGHGAHCLEKRTERAVNGEWRDHPGAGGSGDYPQQTWSPGRAGGGPRRTRGCHHGASLMQSPPTPRPSLQVQRALSLAGEMAELGMPCDRFGYNAILAALARQVRRREITDMVNAILAALARHVGGGLRGVPGPESPGDDLPGDEDDGISGTRSPTSQPLGQALQATLIKFADLIRVDHLHIEVFTVVLPSAEGGSSRTAKATEAALPVRRPSRARPR